MQQFILLLFCVFYNINLLYSQIDSTNIEKTKLDSSNNLSSWFFNINAGVTWHHTDVDSQIDYGFGASFGKLFLLKKNKKIAFDVRISYLRASVSGLDKDSTSFIKTNDNLNGKKFPEINYVTNPGYTVINFQTNIHQLSIEGSIHLNSLKKRKKIDLYALGGIGVTWYQTKSDLTNNLGQYDYSKLTSFDNEAVRNFLDKKYETILNGDSKSSYNFKIMPYLGLGAGYQISPTVCVGIEHKTTITNRDDFDGTSLDKKNGSDSGNKDLFHYTSIFMKLEIKKGLFRKKEKK